MSRIYGSAWRLEHR